VVFVPFQCAVKPDREVVVVALSGELDLVTAPAAARAVSELLDAGFAKVTVDLSGLTFIDVTGLHMLVAASCAAAARSCALSLIPGPDPVQRAFVLTGLDSHFTFEQPRLARRKAARRWAAAESSSSADGRHLRLVR
jgi:anti-sigma B factor antagonist